MSAGSDNQIAVDLKLQLDSLGADAAKAGKIISSGLASSVKGLGETTYEREDRLADEKRQREKRERAARNRKLDEADALNDQKRRAKAMDLFIKDSDKRQQDSKVSRGQILRAGAAGLAGVGLGVPGLGSIAALAQINPVAAAVTASLKILSAAIQMTARSAEEARRYYSKTLQSGFGTQLTIKRSLLANAIGVGENEVWQYGAAVGALNERFSHATKILSEANPVLTQLSWDASVLNADFQALKESLATSLAPAMEGFLEWLDKIAKRLGDFVDKGPKHPEMIPGTRENAKKQQDDLDAANKFAKETLGHGPGVNPFGKDRKEWNETVIKKFDELQKIQYPDKAAAPSPVAYMKQLPASQWEHMGFIVGGSGTNYTRDISKNTARAADFLSKLPKEIADALSKFQKNNPNQVGIPSMP